MNSSSKLLKGLLSIVLVVICVFASGCSVRLGKGRGSLVSANGSISLSGGASLFESPGHGEVAFGKNQSVILTQKPAPLFDDSKMYENPNFMKGSNFENESDTASRSFENKSNTVSRSRFLK